jgi:hypothetical protein
MDDIVNFSVHQINDGSSDFGPFIRKSGSTSPLEITNPNSQDSRLKHKPGGACCDPDFSEDGRLSQQVEGINIVGAGPFHCRDYQSPVQNRDHEVE